MISRRGAVWTLSVAASLAVTLLVLWLVRPAADYLHPDTGHDFMLVYAAAHALRDHQNPYDPVTLLRYVGMTGMPQHFLIAENQFDQPYVYPPLFAWLVIPLTYWSPGRALLVWRVLCGACVLMGTYGLTAPWQRGPALLSSRWRRLVVAALVALAPVALYGLYWGNPVLPVYAAMGGWVWALTRGTRRMDLAAGALMSVGLLKPQLALPLAVLAALCLLRGGDAGHRRRYVAYGFASACVFWLALDLLATGPAMLLDWPLSILYLSRITRLYPDMPSLLGLLQPLVLGFSDASYSALSAVIIALTVVAVGVLYWKLRRVTAAPALLALLTVVWCVGAPYAHANDEILLLPGGLALLVALGGARQVWKDWQRAERDRGGRAAERRALAGVVLAVPALGLLYLGGTLHFITIRGHALPWSVAGPVPLVLLVALGVALPALARQGTSTAARDVEQARGLVPSSTATSPAGMA